MPLPPSRNRRGSQSLAARKPRRNSALAKGTSESHNGAGPNGVGVDSNSGAHNISDNPHAAQTQ